ncbi:SOH1-like protein [Babesia caballi]|uniref:SOH1-like protein n=1 Tax=Babesia caballi TaxID=5871 RepID=A0AAV4LT93_BABCB|nr:SOH1-like protein [Babesia caballi]
MPAKAQPAVSIITRLQDNLKWLEDVRDAKRYVGTDDNLALANKLETLTHLKKCPQNASDAEITQYLTRTWSILEQLLPLLRKCTTDFKNTYVMDNAFVKHAAATTVQYQHLLSRDIVTKALDFLVALETSEVRDVLMRLIGTLRQMQNTEHLCLEHCNNLLLVLHNTGGRIDCREIYDLVTQSLFRVIVDGIDIDALSVGLSVLHIMQQHFPEDQGLQELVDLYIREVKNNIFALETASLLNLLQFMYRCSYVDDGLYRVTMEALLYKYDTMTGEEKGTLLLLLPFLKHMCLLHTPDIAVNVYSEECQMLNATLRREFERRIEHMPFDEMVTYCLALSLMFKQSSVVRKLLLKNLQKDAVAAVDGHTFLKLLSCCNTLHITSSSIDVSRLLSKTAHEKLDGRTGPELLQAFKSLAQIVAKRHRKHLVPLVQNCLEKNKEDCGAIIECLHLYATLNMQRVDGHVLERGFALLFPHLEMPTRRDAGELHYEPLKTIANLVMGERRQKLLRRKNELCEPAGDTHAHELIFTTPCIGKGQTKLDPNRKHKHEAYVCYVNTSNSVVEAIPLRGLIKLLECLVKMELDLAHLVPIFSLIQTSILKRIKYNSAVSIFDLAAILNALTESRVVCTELRDAILDRVYRYPELLDDPECAASILRFIEFTDCRDYAEKLSQPLFEFCLRKPTPALMEVLEYQRHKRPEFHAKYVELMRSVPTEVPDGLGGMVEHGPVLGSDLESPALAVRLPRATGSKSHQRVKEWLLEHVSGQEFEEYYQIGNLVVDFFYPDLGTAVQILKAQDCYGRFKQNNGIFVAACGPAVHLKSRMWLFREILRLEGVRVVMVSERGPQAGLGPDTSTADT